MTELTHIFAGNKLDRMSAQRMDADWIADKLTAAETKFILLCNLKILTQTPEKGRNFITFSYRQLLDQGIDVTENSVLLGLDREGTAFFAARMDETHDLTHYGDYCDLRALAIERLVPEDQLAMAGQGKALIDWHDRHGFCSSCGSPDTMTEGGYKRLCPKCGRMHFPRVDPVVIMLVYRGARCLLGRSAHFIPGSYSALAGFMEPGESMEEAVRREIMEEVGIKIDQVIHHSSQPWPFPSTLMIGCMAHAASENITIDPVEIEDARWFSKKEAATMLAGTHPDGLRVPFPMAIAYHLLTAFVKGEVKD
ncbi:MAG: NAD(+) diphosphatase [Fimbriimonadaceae bacterium]|nr:NAD(+) diphosphatase [Alphaproteobacteria bacterium]